MVSSEDIVDMDFLVAQRLYGSTLSQMYSRIHKDLEKLPRFVKIKSQGRILEIGAGSGEHLKYVEIPYDHYLMTDISDQGAEKLSTILRDGKIEFAKADVQKLPFEDGSFDRLIATCVMAHVSDPFKAFSEIRRVLRISGNATILLSADPGLLLRFLRSLLVKHKMKNLPLDYDLYNALSHRNSYPNLRIIAKEVFKNDLLEFRHFPFRFPSWNLSTHVILHVKKIENQLASK